MAKNMTYIGDKFANLKTGETYRIGELAKMTNNTYRCLTGRLKGKDVVTDWDLRARDVSKIPKSWANQINKPLPSRLDTKAEIQSQKWLSRAI